MGLPCFLLIFFSFVSSAKGDLIHQTCRKTKYYDLCVNSLSSDSLSSKADTKDLATIMVKVGMANATATNAYLSSRKLLISATNDAKKATKECGEKYAFANEALRNSLDDLSAESYDYAYMHVMAAADYPNACHNAFRRYPQLVYPPPLALREDGFKRICDVILGIIDTLGF